MLTPLLLSVAGLVASSQDAVEPASQLYLVHAQHVIVRPGEVVGPVDVLVEDGLIVGLGPDLVAPEGATVVEADTVCAGFIDAWGSLGLEAASVGDFSTNPETHTASAVDPFGQEHLRLGALGSGVLAVRGQVGLHAWVGGVGAVLATAPTAAEPVLLDDACLAFTCGVTRGGRPDVFERVAEADRIGQTLAQGLAYREEWVEYRHELAAWEEAIAEKEAELEKDFKKAKKDRDKELEEAKEKGKEFKEEKYKEDRAPRTPRFDAEREVLARAAHGELPVVVEVHGASELRALLDATESFGRLRLVIAGGTEALGFAERLAARHIPVIVNPDPTLGRASDEWKGHGPALAAALADAGVEVLLGSGGSATATRDLPLLAEVAIGHGLSPEAAFEALTLGAARAFDLADRVGTVEVGKHAELQLLDGAPLSNAPRAVLTGGRLIEL